MRRWLSWACCSSMRTWVQVSNIQIRVGHRGMLLSPQHRRAEERVILELRGQPLLPDLVKDLVSKIRWRNVEESTKYWPLVSMGEHTCTHMYSHLYTINAHTHTHALLKFYMSCRKKSWNYRNWAHFAVWSLNSHLTSLSLLRQTFRHLKKL